MNIVCLKWGDKFDHTHVNRLYKMVCKNFKQEFTFICYTENSDGIDPNIKIVPLNLNHDLEVWWWKLTLFETQTNDVTIFFDLDVVIQHDITHFKDYCEDEKLCVIKAYWKPHRIDMKPQAPWFDMNLNSSIMIWKGDLTEIWNTFIEDPEYYILKYNGIDSFLYFHHFEKLSWLRPGEVYSRLFGYDEENYCIVDEKKEHTTPFYFKEDFNVCIFNGWRRKTELIDTKYILDNDGYDGFEDYY
tara:strand:- start:160 stop:891 length:732 start_codon:yes stop_codon:yes gene_type:complete